jgi:hypothetical protein
MGSDGPEDVSALVKSNNDSLLASRDSMSAIHNSASMSSQITSASESTESPGLGSHPTKPVVQQSDMELISVPPSGSTVNLGPHTHQARQASEVDKGGQPSLHDGTLGLEESQEGEEWADAEHESKRVKASASWSYFMSISPSLRFVVFLLSSRPLAMRYILIEYSRYTN